MFYFTKKPWILKQIYGDVVWDMPKEEKTIYLTFDDGPHPEETDFVLEQLKAYDARGTFFCIGNNITLYPEIFQRVVDAGHSVGNHTFSHLDGWRTNNEKYFADIKQTVPLITTDIFRPPYGHITRFEVKRLWENFHLKTIMWTIMAGDFDQRTSGEKCLHNVIDHGCPGSIVVFHETTSASRNIRYALPRTLDHYRSKGYQFKSIKQFVD